MEPNEGADNTLPSWLRSCRNCDSERYDTFASYRRRQRNVADMILVVEKMLWRREQKTRYDLGREDFVRRIWEWKGEYHQRCIFSLQWARGVA